MDSVQEHEIAQADEDGGQKQSENEKMKKTLTYLFCGTGAGKLERV